MAIKRILIFTNHFHPESFKVNDIAFELAKNNYVVTVLTGIPNYPAGRFYKGYGLLKKRREFINGVDVIRVPLIPRGKNSLLMLSLNYLSYTFFLLIWSFFISITRRFDLILVHHTSPIFLGIPAVLVKKMQRIKMLFWNLDLWPESVSETTGFNNKILMRGLDKIVRFIYRNSDKILISSKSFRSSIANKGMDKDRIIYFPNWSEDVFLNNNIKHINAAEYGLDNDALKIMFAGNIGAAQDMENVMEAIILASAEKYFINWIFVGEGRKIDWMVNRVMELKLEDRVFFLGQYPIEFIPSFFKIADIMLISLKNEKIFSLTVPAKIQTYMASSKPILAMVSGESASIIEEAKCGLMCDAGDYKSLAKNMITFAQMDTTKRKELGDNGFKYYQTFFSKNKAVKSLIDLFKELNSLKAH